MGISHKLIIFSTLLLIVVIGAFATISNLHLDRIISGFSTNLQQELTTSLRKSGVTQVQQLAEATRIALLQNEYDSLQSMAHNIGKRDDRVTRVAIMDNRGILLAHDDPKYFGKEAPDSLKKLCTIGELTVRAGMTIDSKRSIAFATPVHHRGSRLGTVFLALSLELLSQKLHAAQDLKRSEMKKNITTTMLVGLLAVLSGITLTIIQGVRISKPIRSLAIQANRIAEGDLAARVNITSNDEVGELGARFNFMTEKLIDLMLETRQKVALQKELEVAAIVQSSLIPNTNLFEVEGMRLAGDLKPATQCSGDWWGYYLLADDKVLVLIGDVTGHGVASAMVAAAVNGAMNNLLMITQRRLDLTSVLTALDNAVYAAAEGRFHMTCFASIYDPATRSLSFGNAGHVFPYYYQEKVQRLGSLTVAGKSLGDGRTWNFEIGERTVEPGDTVVYFTDGIAECENEHGEQFARTFRRLIPKYTEMAAEQMRDQIVHQALEFCSRSSQNDDITVVVAKFG